jgi:ribonucleotide monophosphatase NagD (HAD superfamily)
VSGVRARAGVRSALVLTGSHGRADVAAAQVKPQFIFDDLAGFEAWLWSEERAVAR